MTTADEYWKEVYDKGYNKAIDDTIKEIKRWTKGVYYVDTLMLQKVIEDMKTNESVGGKIE